VGRLRELAEIGAPRPGGDRRLLLFAGPFGAGKTALLRAAGDQAREHGTAVAHAQATEPASGHAFGVAFTLVGPALAEAALARAGHAGKAADTLDAAGETAVRRALAEAVLRRAAEEPLLLTVDDAHLADAPSLALLAHLGTAPEGTGLSIVATVRRDAEPGPGAPLFGLYHAASTIRVLEPLSDADARVLVEERLGSSGSAERLLHLAAGNPLLLAALADAVARGETSRLGDPVPPTIVTRAQRELRRLDGETPAVARALAILARPAPLARVAAVAGLSLDAVDRAAETLEAAGLIDGGPELAFVQPLTARAVVAGTPAREQTRLHTRASELLHEADEPLDEIAGHLLHADRLGRDWAVDALLDAELRARAAGEHDEAVAFGRRALDEPPGADRRTGVLRELAFTEADAGLPEAADRLREAMRLSVLPDERARCALRLGQLLMVAGDRAGAGVLLDGMIELSGDVSGPLADELRAARAVVAVNDLQVDAHERIAELERLSPEYAGPIERSGLAVEAMTGTFMLTLDHERAIALCRRALAGGALLSEETAGGITLRFVTGTLATADALDLGLEVTEALVVAEEARGARLGLAAARYSRAWQRYYRGEVAGAISSVREALDEAPADWAYMPPARAVLGLALLERDEPDAAAEAADLEPRPAWQGSILWPLLLCGQARIAVARGETDTALALTAQVRALEQVTGASNPALLDRGAIETLARVQAGDRDGAHEVATRDLEQARRWGAPRAVGTALRSLALATMEADLEAAVALLVESQAVLQASPSGLERVRTELDLGIALRRSGRLREAREPLAQALHTADDLGLLALARRAREELAVSGARPRRNALSGVDALTPAERRTATLAAAGRTNKAIAAELFVTVKAVEKHLGATYDKLGIRSRRELADHLGPDD